MMISGKKFAITGANRGIGLAVAEVAAARGSHLILAGRSFQIEEQERLKSLGAASVHFIKCDLSTHEGVDSLGSELQKLEVDILFNNAGLLTGGLLEEQSLDDIDSMFQVNVVALVHLTRAVLPGMIQRGCGKIINNSSVSAYMHFPCASTYAASKAAVLAFTNCMEAELIGTGVSTLCLITPGVKTRMFDEIEMKYGKNLETPKDTISPAAYAEQIASAIEADQSQLYPGGSTAWGLWVARYLGPLFRRAVKERFKR